MKVNRIGKRRYIEEIAVIIFLIILLMFIMSVGVTSRRINSAMNVVQSVSKVRAITLSLVMPEKASQSDSYVLLSEVDGIFYELQNGVTLELENVFSGDKVFQNDIAKLKILWEELNVEIELAKENGYKNTDLVKISSEYIELSNEIADYVESDVASKIEFLSIIELVFVILIVFLIMYVIVKMIKAIKLDKINKDLEQKAYIDLHTMLSNKSKCKELIFDSEKILRPTGIIVFDLNYLKKVNDTLGHIAGDALIESFANIIRNDVDKKDFVGRYCGDEFIAIVYDANEKYIDDIIININNSVIRYNSLEKNMEMSYAYGYCISTKEQECTLKELLEQADSNMYKNKSEHHLSCK